MKQVEKDYWAAGGRDTTKQQSEFGYHPDGPSFKSLAQGNHTYKGMLVFQLRQAGTPDVTRGQGVSVEHDQYLLTGQGVPEETHTMDYSRVLVLQKDSNGTLKAVPLLEQEQGKKTVFGGTFIWNNKNFKKLNPYPLPVHDRII